MTDKREQDHQGDAFRPIRWLLLSLLFLRRRFRGLLLSSCQSSRDWS